MKRQCRCCEASVRRWGLCREHMERQLALLVRVFPLAEVVQLVTVSEPRLREYLQWHPVPRKKWGNRSGGDVE